MITPSELTFGALKESSVANIAGVCVGKPSFRQQTNEVISRLMTYGNFWNTTVKGRACVYNNCIAWPRQVGTILGFNAGNYTRPIQNQWYDFMPVSAGDCHNSRAWTAATTLVDNGVTPVFQNIPCDNPQYVRVYCRVRADIGKTVTLYGPDQYGQEVMIRDDGTGLWTQGETLTLVSGYVQSTKKYREITRISKELTTAPIDVYMYDDDTDTLREIAHYEASETEPRYRHTTLQGGYCNRLTSSVCSTDGSSQRMITFLAKLKHIPVVLDTDIVQIDCIPAIKLMIQAIRLEEAGDDDSANKKQAMAIKELNRQLSDKLPLNQLPIFITPEGTAEPSRAGIGMLI